MRALKIAVIVLCTLVVLIAGLLTAAVFLINPNDYKDEIAAAVKKQTGRELTIQGDIALSVFPWLGIDLGQISLGNAPGFSNPLFAGIDKAEVRIKIMPLFAKQVQIGTVVLDGLQVNLERQKNGATNWDDLATAKKEQPDTQESATEPEATKEKTGFALAALAVDGVQIKNGTISFKDAQGGTQTTVDKVALTATQIALKSPFDVFFGFNVHQSTPKIDARITLEGKTTIDPEAGSYDFSGAALSVTGIGPSLPGGSVSLQCTTDIAANLPQELLSLSNIALAAYGLDLKGEIKGTTILSSPNFKGKFTLAECNPGEFLQNIGQSEPKTSDPSVLKALKADLAFTASQTAAQLTSLNITLDQTTLKGTGSVKNFSSPAIVFALDVDTIDVDRYLPPKKNQPEATTSGSSGPTRGAATPKSAVAQSKQQGQPAVAIPLPVDQLRHLDLTGKMTLGKLTVNKLNLADIVVHILAKNGLITVDPMAANLYQGAFKGNTVLDVRGKVPSMKVNETLFAMQVGPLLKDMTGKDTLTGTTQSTASLTTAGITPGDLKANLNGNLTFTFTDGSIQGINIPKMLRDAVLKIKGGTPDPSEVNETDFASLGGTAKITNGVLDNRDLLMMSPLMRLNGAGQVNIPREGLDYLLTATVVSSLKGQKGEPLAELAGLSVPIRIAGTFARPKFTLDLASLLKDKGMQELEDKIGEKLFKDKKIGKALEGLFK
ncbi:MAG: AsmA family protein [Desulfoplanes sp.]